MIYFWEFMDDEINSQELRGLRNNETFQRLFADAQIQEQKKTTVLGAKRLDWDLLSDRVQTQLHEDMKLGERKEHAHVCDECRLLFFHTHTKKTMKAQRERLLREFGNERVLCGGSHCVPIPDFCDEREPIPGPTREEVLNEGEWEYGFDMETGSYRSQISGRVFYQAPNETERKQEKKMLADLYDMCSIDDKQYEEMYSQSRGEQFKRDVAEMRAQDRLKDGIARKKDRKEAREKSGNKNKKKKAKKPEDGT
jgi:hypothetical protein